MKKVTLFIDDDYSDVISITAVGVRGYMTNLTVSAQEIKYDDVIHIPAKKGVETNANN